MAVSPNVPAAMGFPPPELSPRPTPQPSNDVAHDVAHDVANDDAYRVATLNMR